MSKHLEQIKFEIQAEMHEEDLSNAKKILIIQYRELANLQRNLKKLEEQISKNEKHIETGNLYLVGTF